jgi:hypothetical protein
MTIPQRQPGVTVDSFAIPCATEGCDSIFAFSGGSVSQFMENFDTAHQQGWLCRMKTVLDMTCPECNRRPRALQQHQVMRRRLAKQPKWKRDIVVFAWAAMADIDDDYLRTTDMPMWLDSLLGNETTPTAEHVRNALEHMESALGYYKQNWNATEAARLAGDAVRGIR